MKKIALSLVLALCIAFGAALCVSAEKSGYFTYTVSNGKATITDCDTSINGDVVIPATIGGYPVTIIGDSAFFDCTSLASIDIPDSVTSIGSDAFRNCTRLASIDIPNSVTSIGRYAFVFCTSLKDVYYTGTEEEWNEMTIADEGNDYLLNATIHFNNQQNSETGENTFEWSLDDAGTLTIGGNGTMPNWTYTDTAPWYSTRSLIKEVVISNGITSIGEYAFYYCSNLESIDIADTVKTIGKHAFDLCNGLISIELPNSVTTISESAFCKCMYLRSIVIPKSVITIDSLAFAWCTNLSDVYYTSAEDKWDKIAVASGNDSLLNATIHYNYVPASENLENYKLGDNITWKIKNNVLTISGTGDMYDFQQDNRLWLEDDNYYSTIELKKIVVSEGITSIGSYVFENCLGRVNPDNDNYRLPLELVVPSTVTYIGNQGSTYITKFSVSENNNYYSSENGILYNKNKTSLVFYPMNMSYMYYAIPSTVERIEEYAFVNQEEMTAIYVPKSVKFIGENEIYCKRVYYECSKDEFKNIYIAPMPDYRWNCFANWEEVDSYFNANVSDLTALYKKPEKIIGTYYFVPNTNISSDYKNTVSQLSYYDDFSYNDNYFDGDPDVYNHSLARTSIRLAMSAFAKKYVKDGKIQYDKQYQNVENFMSKMKFTNIEHNDGYETPPTVNSIGVAAGMKKVSFEKSGECTLIVVAIRGGEYEREWAGNFNVGAENIHAGFKEASDKVMEFLAEYIVKNVGYDEQIKLWITGYSRAAATTNITAKRIIDGELMCEAYINDVYAYCFETPMGVRNSENYSCYNCIFSIVNQHDFVPMVAPNKWGYGRYGVTKFLPSVFLDDDYAEKNGDMSWRYRKLMSEISYSASKATENVIPKKDKKGNYIPDLKYAVDTDKIDNFRVKQLKWNLFDGLYIDNASNYLPQGVFLERTIDKVANYLVSPEYYTANYQKTIMYIVENTLGCGSLNAFLDALKNNALITSSFVASPGFTEIEVRSIIKQSLKDVGLSIDDISLSLLEGLLFDLFADNSIFTFIENTDSILQGHYPELCLTWLDAIGPNDFSSTRLRTIFLNCPVDVEVYNSNNELVAAIYSDVPQKIEGSSIVALVDENGQKIIYLPENEEYRIVATATDEGEVNISMQEFDFETGETKVVNYLDMQVVEGDYMTSVIENISEDDVTYELQFNSLEVEPDDLIESAEKYVVHTNVEGNGNAAGGGTYFKGEFAKVTATALSNETFEGWYVGNDLVSTDVEYRFMVDDDMEITAKFSENKCRVVFLSEEEIIAITEIDKGQAVTLPDIPEKPGMSFDGWYFDEEYTSLFNAETEFEEDCAIYAKYNVSTDEFVFDDESAVIYDESRALLTNVYEATTAEDLAKNFKNKNLVICDEDGYELAPEEFVSTGTVVKIVVQGTVIVDAKVIILGDVYPDGLVNIKDAIKLAQYLSGNNNNLTEFEISAGNIDESSDTDYDDLIKLVNSLTTK